MKKFIADIATMTTDQRYFYNSELRDCVKARLESFPDQVASAAVAWIQSDDIDYLALPFPAQKLLTKPGCMSISLWGYSEYLQFLADSGITESSQFKDHYRYSHNNWSVYISKTEITHTINEYYFCSADVDDWDIHSFIGGYNLFFSPRRRETLQYAVNKMAHAKWERLVAAEADKSLNVAGGKKVGWFDRLLGRS